MNRFFLTVATAFFTFAVLLSISSVATAQSDTVLGTFAPELRPFDFSKNYYYENGIYAEALIGRHDGADGQSVFDTSTEPEHTNVRITATMPAYSAGGTIVFWNYHAGVPREAFMDNKAGVNTMEAAYQYPLYVFPSETVKRADRQAAMISIDENYATKNPLGVAAVIMVEFTDRIFTSIGQRRMNILRDRNGASLDGTPIIRTAKELESLTLEGYVRQRQADETNSERTPFAVARALEAPQGGSITPDAFLVYVTQGDGQALPAEQKIVTYFECLQNNQNNQVDCY
jgi:hypothetical protein